MIASCWVRRATQEPSLGQEVVVCCGEVGLDIEFLCQQPFEVAREVANYDAKSSTSTIHTTMMHLTIKALVSRATRP